jgi:hypothetical protein
MGSETDDITMIPTEIKTKQKKRKEKKDRHQNHVFTRRY